MPEVASTKRSLLLIGEEAPEVKALTYIYLEGDHGREGEALTLLKNAELTYSRLNSGPARLEVSHSFACDDDGSRARLAVFELASLQFEASWGNHFELTGWLTAGYWYGPTDSGFDSYDEEHERVTAQREGREPDYSTLPNVLHAQEALEKTDPDYTYANSGYPYFPPEKRGFAEEYKFPLRVRLQTFTSLKANLQSIWERNRQETPDGE